MKVEIKPGFAAFFSLMTLLCGRYAAQFFAVLLVHEAGHFAACYLLGGKVRRFSLRFADCEIETADLGYGAEAICAAVGPAVNIFLFFLLKRNAPVFAAMNFLLASYNLLPVWPLDGARCVYCLLCTGKHAEYAWVAIRLCGLVICSALLIFALAAGVLWKLGLWPLAAALLLFSRLALTAERGNGCFFSDAAIE